MHKLALVGVLVFLMVAYVSSQGQEKTKFKGPDEVEFSIFPNPFRENITLVVTANATNLKVLKITNLIGKEIAEVELGNKTGNFSQKLEFDHLEPGIYFFTLYSTKGAVETKKVVKLR